MNGGGQGVRPVLDGHYNPVAMGLVRSRVIHAIQLGGADWSG